MNPPLIGITTGFEPDKGHVAARQTLNWDYVAAVERAGGCPLILPMTKCTAAVEPLFHVLDGLIITGGPGIVEGLVGDLPGDLPPVSPLRYENDCRAFEAAQKKRIPVLGICYGMQFVNARFGGALYADVQEQLGIAPHSPKRTGGASIQHPIEIAPGTHLCDMLGTTRCETNSFHLQALATVGPGLRISARSEDAVIEGIESEDGRILGVQFHPEKMPGALWDRVFGYFFERAKKQAKAGKSVAESE